MKIIYIRQGLKEKKRVYRVFVDDEDYEWLNDLKSWHVNQSEAVQLRKIHSKKDGGKMFTRSMARLIMFLPPGRKGGHDLTVDHIDGNRLNNQKENLRICTMKENVANPKTQSGWKSGIRNGGGWKKTYAYQPPRDPSE